MTKKNIFSHAISRFLCFLLIAVTALNITACGPKKDAADQTVPQTSEQTPKAAELGEGNTSFVFVVTDAEGNDTTFSIKTDETTVGAALLKLELIAGDDSEFGLYVKTVNGITLDFDTDGYYWSFYVDGEYATSGVDSTDITEGATYAFKAEKG